MDSAFCSRGNDFFIKLAQNLTGAEGPVQHMVLKQVTSMRQAKWGVRALQGSSPRLECTMIYEKNGDCQTIIECVVLLYNCCANTVGLNQICTMCMPHLDQPVDFDRCIKVLQT